MINRSRIREREYFHAEGSAGMSRILERRENPEGAGSEEEEEKKNGRFDRHVAAPCSPRE